MTIHRAEWLLPIAAPPVRDGWVAVEGGRITARGAGGPPGGAAANDRPFPGRPIAILPALVNAHTHLELSYLQGLVPPASRFDRWVRSLMAFRRARPDPAALEITGPAARAIAQARASGTGLFGDISNTFVTFPLLDGAGVTAHVFLELLGFSRPHPEQQVLEARARIGTAVSATGRVRASLAPHAPYSTSPALFAAIRRDRAAGGGAISSVHLGESPEELQFLEDGGGPLRGLLEEIGAWSPAWTPPCCGPVEYLERLGLLDAGMLVVHGVQFTGEDIARAAAAGATIVTCPRSNGWTGVGDPPVAAFYSAGARVAIGTDSLASVDDLNMFAEMAAVRRLARGVPASRILESATRVGAEALGFGDELGTLEPGKRAALIAVPVPEGVEDVEEYLVSGVSPGDVAWLS